MTLTFAQLSRFAAKWRKMRLTDEDLAALERQIMDAPQGGEVMVGTGGVRKIRFAPPSWNTGRSGAIRVCYAMFANVQTTYLLTLFAKSDKPNLSNADKATIKTWMHAMKNHMKGSTK